MEGQPDLIGPTRLQELFRAHGIRPKRSLGQNFVIDPNTIRKVIDVAHVTAQDSVLEVGAGAGSLTLGLASSAAHVTALEIDERLLPVLNEVLGDVDNVTIVQGDALTLDLGSIAARKVVANLPYNVATPVVLRILELAPQISELVVMTQREVGERLAATPGSKVYGSPTLATAFFAQARVAASISRRAFWPVPNVDSVLVSLRRIEDARPVAFEPFVRLVRAGFAQRRKSLRNSLGPLFGGASAAEEILRGAGIDPGARPEELHVDDFLGLAHLLETD